MISQYIESCIFGWKIFRLNRTTKVVYHLKSCTPPILFSSFLEISHEVTKTRKLNNKEYICVFVPLWQK